MQNKNSPAFPQQDFGSEGMDQDVRPGMFYPGFTKWEFITLEIFKALIQGNPPQQVFEIGGNRRLTVPPANETAALAVKLTEAVLLEFDQHASGQAANHPLNQRSTDNRHVPGELEITDD